ncbi:MAG: anaerobic ribonucleoside-triphosphate reductase activating protein [Lachnospiraceae bacterium]|nr:anaerobic ribonucleoside-triphosphate reductase activating protein [Lachnospiraceae bacterium]
MKFYALDPTTLLNYPGKLACTVFTGGCNFRCGYCHNASLVLPGEEPGVDEEEVLRHWNRRKNILEGVCVTGGEPTLQAELPGFLRRLKDAGALVKLDTNGSRPEVLSRLYEEKLVDYTAMDIKADPKGYPVLTGCDDDLTADISRSVRLVMDNSPDYEFRTTVTAEYFNEKVFHGIGEWIRGAKAWYLQSFRDSGALLSSRFHPPERELMKEGVDIMSTYVKKAELRGSD